MAPFMVEYTPNARNEFTWGYSRNLHNPKIKI